MVEAIRKDKLNIAEEQIEQQKQEIDYDTREFTIEIIVNKYLEQEEEDNNEIYVPEYQREFVWDNTRQSRFIESVILGLPIPLIFVAEIKDTGRLEIVDGSQRIRTLEAFLNNKLKLINLKKLDSLNDFYFKDLLPARQRKFKNTPMRMIVLADKADEEVRNDMFDRINTGSVDLTPMEARKGLYRGEFIDFVFECSTNNLLKEICPISKYFKNRNEEAELVLRFLAFSETYPKFSFLGKKNYKSSLERTGVIRFLDEYVMWKNDDFNQKEKQRKLKNFEDMLIFVKNTFPSGFKRYSDSDSTSRPYFESISVGSFLALQENPNLKVKGLWNNGEKNNQKNNFRIPISRYQTHTPVNMLKRIDYVKNKLLEFSR